MKIVYVFIDASNLWQIQKAKGLNFDYQKLDKFLKQKFQTSSLQIFYYTAYPADGTRSYAVDGKHKFFTYLTKGLSFIVRKKPLKRILIHDEILGDHIQEKGNMDVEMAIDVVHHISKYDTAVFFSGDSDFLALVRYIHSRGKEIYVFSSKNNVSQELRTGADGYTDLLGIQDDIWGSKIQRRKK
jgi:uncharacterized LabA/DUF88 family protein